MTSEKSKRAGKLTPADPDYIYLAPSMQQRLDDAAKPFDPKTEVWIADAKETFIAGKIVQEEDGDKVTVEVVRQDGTADNVSLSRDKCMPMNPPKYDKTDDMSDLTHLNEAAVLYNLQRRYRHMLIYTYSGLFCVAINPYKWLPIYTDKMRDFYRGKRRNEAPPHLYAISDGAYQFMLLERKSQSMLITGESGAGKTENTKKVIQYFALTAAEKKPEGEAEAAAAAAASGGSKKGSLEDQIVQANPVLEAYGNAKTVRNNNSSRFGKFIRIHFKPNWKISGADVETYLLEKSRITFQLPIERNYHIFYQLLSEAYPEYHRVMTLTPDASIYSYINQGRLTVEGMDDKKEMQDTDAAFDILGFTQEEKIDLFKGTGSICYLGNTVFGQRGKDEQAVVDTKDELSKIAALLGLDEEEFTDCLLKPKIKVGNDYVKKGQNKDQVSFAVAALAKSLYSRMFEWLVNKVNDTLDVKASQSQRVAFIGVLDIAGFEIFELNTFEQLCINYTNERLQQFFNHHMFVLEQEEYKKEGIEWEFIDFGLDLDNTIALIEKKMGILSILEEECIVPKATDKTFLEKLMNTHMGKHPSFGKPKPAKKGKAESHFEVHHYAGTVAYNVAGWLFKNKDPINESLVFILKDAKNALVSLIFGESDEGTKKKKGGSMNTISQLHRESLLKLMSNLQSTHPHFVRCLIPNEFKQSGVIDAGLVMHQLTCNGVLEGIRICRKGFPNRIAYLDFIQRYGVLKLEQGTKKSGEIKDLKVIARELLNCTSLTDHFFKLGHTKIFFKSGVLAQMEEWREDALSEILRVIQASARQAIQMITFKVKRAELNSWRMLQRNVRSWCQLIDDPLMKIRQMITGEMLEIRHQLEEEARLAKLAESIAAIQETLNKATQEREAAERVNLEFSRRKDEMVNLSASLRESVGSNMEAIEEMTKAIDEKTAQEKILQKQIAEERQKLVEQKKKEEAALEAQLLEAQNEKARMDMNGNEAADKLAIMHGDVINVEAKNTLSREEIKMLQENMTHFDDKIRRLIHEKRELWDLINVNRQRHWGFRFFDQVLEGYP